jgi:molybdopterin-guanine dinucleotide biosynthesis protein A
MAIVRALPAITAVILAGGRATRMNGADKGLQKLHGVALAEHVLRRLRTQTLPPAAVLINANRNLPDYRALGVPVWPDEEPNFLGPLAGFLSGLAHCGTPLLLTVPCDVPCFPLTLCERLAHALLDGGAQVATVCTLETQEDSTTAKRMQPAFCLIRRELEASLRQFVAQGGHKVRTWIAEQEAVLAPFVQSSAGPSVFANVNTFDDLRSLERSRTALGD